MNNTINIKIKYIILIICIFLVLLLSHFTPTQNKSDLEVVKTESIVLKKNIDSISKQYLKKDLKPTVVYVDSLIVKKTRLKSKKRKSKPPKGKVVAYQYKDTLKLNNGTVFTDIITTGDLLKQDIKLISFDKIITRKEVITNKKYLVENVWFLNLEPKFSLIPVPQFTGIGLTVDYTIKQKIRLGLGVEYNSFLPGINKVSLNFKIGIRL